MSISFDSAANGSETDVGGSVTFSHTCTGFNLILLVGVQYDSAAAVTVTYNGISMTQLDSVNSYDTAGSKNSMFYLVSPSTGSNSVVATTTGGGGYISASSSSYSGVRQSNPIDNHAAENASNSINAQASPWSVSMTSAADNCWLIAMMGTDGGNPTNAGTNTTKRSQEATTRVTGMFDNNAAIHPAGSASLQISGWGGSRNAYAVKATIAPFIPNVSSEFLNIM